MKRVHLFELADQPWFPPVFRDIMTDSLQFGTTRLRYYDAAVPLLGRLLSHMQTAQVVDLCSGATGPWLGLRELLARDGHPDIAITFTDRHVNEDARRRIEDLGDPGLRYLDRSVDACAVPADLPGVRTIFTGFHHLAPGDARRVLEDTVRQGRAIGIFEFTDRSAQSFAMASLVPLGMFLTTPFIRPLKVERFLWTYVLPVVPLCNMWDGIVSNLRTYSPEELSALVPPGSEGAYFWESGQIRAGGAAPPLTYLIGAPRDPRASQRSGN